MGVQQVSSRVRAASERVAAFGGRCRAAGLADTPQRLLIYRCLAESVDHPTAEALFLRVKPHLSKVSLATVYRNLKLFAEAGLIDEVATGRSLSRYDGNQDRHHHLICKACGGVADYYDDKLDGLAVATAAGLARGLVAGGFEVHDVRLDVFGVCAACRAGKDGTKGKAAGAGSNDRDQPPTSTTASRTSRRREVTN